MVLGTRTFGKCDAVAGIGYVATKFFHINFLPLIPLQGHFVFEGSEGAFSYRAIEMPVSGKSIGLAWLRVLLCLAIVVPVAGIIFNLVAHDRSWLWLAVSVVGFVASVAAFWYSYRLFPASAARKVELLTAAGFGLEDIPKILALGEAAAQKKTSYFRMVEEAAKQPQG